MTRFRLLLVMPLLVLVFFTGLAHGQAPLCGDSCNGGSQTAGNGGGSIQIQASTSNQRGVGGSGGVVAQPAGKSINIEGSQSYTYPCLCFRSPAEGLI